MSIKNTFALCLLVAFVGSLSARSFQIQDHAVMKMLEKIMKKSKWDSFVFSQEWPSTVCSSSGRTCHYPQNKNTWTVHGLWPSNSDGSYGPSNCETQAEFSEEALAPILDDLEKQWTDVFGENDEYSFWEHEWSKHGTCASTLKTLNSVEKYFDKGLELNKMYNLTAIFEDNGILPGNSYTVEKFEEAVENVTGGKTSIVCAHKGSARIQEVRICMDKQFNIIDCIEAHNCKTDKVHYEDN